MYSTDSIDFSLYPSCLCSKDEMFTKSPDDTFKWKQRNFAILLHNYPRRTPMLVRVSGRCLVRLSGNKPDPLAISFRLQSAPSRLHDQPRASSEALECPITAHGANQKLSVSRTNQNPITIRPPDNLT
ncbi:hypothetical protein PoB_004802900 [Plakobranchus ocellatus]|uniref:Uncharacterized protein n=1 Tax=Plakobranchus ocellatus TaxID=259542 RepID=A0AAV4BT22_9GAST|nr:hypothetical protein PoB_004802900 [Plakobranchus ocellatus]